MRFRCERDVLVDALSTASRAVTNRGGALPVLSGLRLGLDGDLLTIDGSDLDLTITVEVKVAGDVDGKVVIPSKLIVDIVKALESGSVTVDFEGESATVSGGRSEFSVHVIPADEYPQLSEPEADSLTMEAEQFSEALRQVVPAASSDDSRPILTGVLMTAETGGLRLVATDSYRLGVRDLPGASVLDEGQSVLVPSRALHEVSRLMGSSTDLTLVLGEREASFLVDGVKLTTRLIEGDFPNYKGLIPQEQSNKLTVGRAALLEALKRVKLMAREATPVRLTMSQGSVELVAITQDVGKASEQLDADYSGEDLTVAFNPEYLLEGLEVTPGDEVVLGTQDELKPALLRSTEVADFLYLLMPVRVS